MCMMCASRESAGLGEDADGNPNPICSFRSDVFHRIAAIARAVGAKHVIHASMMASLSHILFRWEMTCYSNVLEYIMQAYQLDEKYALKEMARFRRTNPSKVATFIPKPSVLLPDLEKWIEAYADVKDPDTGRSTLKLDTVKKEVDRLVTEIAQGRISDDCDLDQLHTVMQGPNKVSGLKTPQALIKRAHVPH